MNTHDFPRTPLNLMNISGNAQLDKKIDKNHNVLFMCILYIYNFLFYIFSFIQKYPYENLIIKVCNRALFQNFLLTNWFSYNYIGTIYARFRHDLYNFAVHCFFRQLYKIVRKIVHTLLPTNLHFTSFSKMIGTKAHSFSLISARGVLIICSFFQFNHQISFAHGTTDCRR